jgi:hypothetical protein
LRGVLHIRVFGCNTMPSQVFQLETGLPFFAIAALVKHNLSISRMNEVVVLVG